MVFFSLVINIVYNNKKGEWIIIMEWYCCVVFGNKVEVI